MAKAPYRSDLINKITLKSCFDRMKQIHHPECKNKFGKRSKIDIRPITNIKKTRKCELTHYQETFRSNYNPRPATAYQPPQDSFVNLPKGTMDFNTIQKTEFPAYEPQERVKPIKAMDNHEVKSHEPFKGKTAYQMEYFLKENKGLSNIVKKIQTSHR